MVTRPRSRTQDLAITTASHWPGVWCRQRRRVRRSCCWRWLVEATRRHWAFAVSPCIPAESCPAPPRPTRHTERTPHPQPPSYNATAFSGGVDSKKYTWGREQQFSGRQTLRIFDGIPTDICKFSAEEIIGAQKILILTLNFRKIGGGAAQLQILHS